MADNVNPSVLLEALCKNETRERAAKELYKQLTKYKNKNEFADIYLPSSFLPVLAHIFVNRSVGEEPLKHIACTIKSYFELSCDLIKYVVPIETFIKEICDRLVVTDLDSYIDQDLAEECENIMDVLCIHMEPNNSSLPVCVESLSKLLQNDNTHVADGAFRCFVSLSKRFNKTGTDPAPLAQHGLVNALVIKLSNSGTPLHPESPTENENKSLNTSDTLSKESETLDSISISTNESHSQKSELFSSVSTSTVIELLIALCTHSRTITQDLLRSNLSDDIEKIMRALKDDERCILKCMKLIDLLLVYVFEGRIPKRIPEPTSSNSKLHAQLINLIQENDCEGLIAAVNSRDILELNFLDKNGQTLLNWASAFGSPEMVEFLCERGADVNKGQISSSLHYAAFFGRPEVAKVLLRHGADPDLRDEVGKTPFELAIERMDDGHKEVALILQSPGEWKFSGKTNRDTDSEEESTELKGDPEMATVYIKRMLPLLCKKFQSTILRSIRKSILNLIRKMIDYIQASLLTEICVSESPSGNLGTMLVEVIASVLDNKDEADNQSLIVQIIRDLMVKNKSVFLDNFDKQGIIVKVLELIISGDLQIGLSVDKRISQCFYQDDEIEAAGFYKNPKEIFLNKTYRWKNWCFGRSTDFLYIWSEAVALKLPKNSNGWFEYFLNEKLHTMYSSGSFESEIDTSENEEEFFGEPFQNIKKEQAKPILSYPGCTKIIFGNWTFSAHVQGEINIMNNHEPSVIRITKNVRFFVLETNRKKKLEFTAKSALGIELPSSILELKNPSSKNLIAVDREETSSPATKLVTTLVNMPEVSAEIKEQIYVLYDHYSSKKELCDKNERMISNLNKIVTELLTGKIVLDRITFCNRFRKILVQIEIHYAKSQMVDSYNSYKFIYEAMISIFNIERKIRKDRTIENHPSQKYKNVVKTISRKEFWRIIFTWLFFEKFNDPCLNYNTGISENLSLSKILSMIECEKNLENVQILLATCIYIHSKTFRDDQKYRSNSQLFSNLSTFETAVISQCDFKAPPGIHQIFNEISFLAKGICDGFQVASERIKEVEDLASIQDQIDTISKSITEKKEDIKPESKELINTFMNIIVNTHI